MLPFGPYFGGESLALAFHAAAASEGNLGR